MATETDVSCRLVEFSFDDTKPNESAAELEKTPLSNVGRYSARTLPAAGALLRGGDVGETQMKLDI